MKFIYLLLIFLPIVSLESLPRVIVDTTDEPEGKIPESIFTVVAPSDIRRGQPYNVYVRGFSLEDQITLNIKIRETGVSAGGLYIKKKVTISSENSKASVAIDTSNIPKGNYILQVNDGEDFSENRTLTYVTKSQTFLILLNKAIFLPGDLVQYKIFAINHETKAINPKCLSTVSVSDPNKNAVSSVQNVTFRNGRYAGDFEISKRAGLGNWQLKIECDEESITKQFEVAEYDLPMVEAKLTIPPKIPISFGKVPVTVDVSYTFGGDANGNATIRFEKIGRIVFTKEITIDSGSTTFDVDLVHDLQMTHNSYGYVKAYLIFNDILSDTKSSDTANFFVSKGVYSTKVESDVSIVEGKPFKFTVTVIKYDGSPAQAGLKVQVISEKTRIDTGDQDLIPQQTLTLEKGGSVSSSIDVPKNVKHITLRFKVEEATDEVIAASENFGGSFIRLSLLTKTPRVNHPVQLKIMTGEPVEYVMLHILSKGILMKSEKIYFDEECDDDGYSNSAIYSFKPTFKYIPTAQILAYYIDRKGKFHTKRVDVRLNNDLPNYLKITPYDDEVKPGSKAYFNIESTVDSTVSLMAVDQRVVLLKGGSEITKLNVFNELNKYNSYRTMYDWKNIADYERTFGQAGLLILTNIPRPVRRPLPKNGRPMASERAAKPARPDSDAAHTESSNKEVQIREDFRQTFLWRDVYIESQKYDDVDYDDEYYNHGLETISEKVPESITKYLIYGVSMSKYDGIGLTEDVTSVTTFLPFFLSVEFPYSVKRNEILKQNIIVHNYLRKGQTFEIKIKKDPKFEGIELDQYGWKESHGFYVQSHTTKFGIPIKLQFAIKPTALGFVSFEVTAKGPVAGDGLKKQLRVIPEGIARSITKSALIALDPNTPSFESSLHCNLPPSAYEDTTEISATIAGDLFGKALTNFDNLIRLPNGCGEQTLVTLVPQISIYFALLYTSRLTPALKVTLEKHITAGYVNELKYQRNDGSFSAFGKQDPAGSTWLTAVVIGYFAQASSIVQIDQNVIKRGAAFVAKQQATDGSFKEVGRVIHTDMQGGSGKGIALTAYCTLVFSMLQSSYPEYGDVKIKGVTYLENALATDTSSFTTYELAIIAYVLTFVSSSQAYHYFDLLYARKTETDTHLYFTAPAPLHPGYWHDNAPRSLDIEATSYALLAETKRNEKLSVMLKIVNYLISQTNSLGGFGSTQDTVVAYNSLGEFAKIFKSSTNVDLKLKPDIGNTIHAKIDDKNVFEIQSFELNSKARKLKEIVATSSSSGVAIVSLVCNFYEDPTKVVPTFNVTYNLKSSCTTRVTFDACGRYLQTGNSNMAVMIVTLPSGFIYSGTIARKIPNVSKTEVTHQGSKVTFYFNSISYKESCVTVTAYRSKFVADLKGGTIQVLDYYDTSKEGSTGYDAPDLSQPCYIPRRMF